ncbi:MAG: ABC transporter permease [Bacteroidota bacterium]
MIKIALKDLRIFFKDKRLVLLTFTIPIALISLFAFAFGGMWTNDDDEKITLLISDLDHSEASKKTISLLDSLKGIELIPSKLKEAQAAIRKGNESFVLVINQGFSEAMNSGTKLPLELQYDQANDMEVAILQQSLLPTLSTLPFKLIDSSKMMANPPREMANNPNPMHALPPAAIPNDIKMTPLIIPTQDANIGLIQAVAGTSVLMLLFSVVGFGMGLIDERQEGTLKRLYYAPINPINVLYGKMICVNIISLMQMIVMFVFTSVAFGLDIITPLPGLMVTIVATSFTCSAFGLFLASIAQSRQQVQGLSTLIILVMSALGGSMIPIFIMPALMQKAAVISLNYWSIQSFFDVFWRNLSVTNPTFLLHIGILLLMGLVLNVIAIIFFKKNYTTLA